MIVSTMQAQRLLANLTVPGSGGAPSALDHGRPAAWFQQLSGRATRRKGGNVVDSISGWTMPVHDPEFVETDSPRRSAEPELVVG